MILKYKNQLHIYKILLLKKNTLNIIKSPGTFHILNTRLKQQNPTAETDELLQLYHDKINNTTIMEALQHTKALELFIQNADSLNSFMVVTRCGKLDKSETALCKFYPYYNLF